MNILTLYVTGYLVTFILLLASYGYKAEKDDGDFGSFYDEAYTWLIALVLSFLWPIIWSYFLPVYCGVLFRKIVKGAPGPEAV